MTDRPAPTGDRGLASITAVAGVAVLLAALASGVVVADLLSSRARAAAAADLAALAAAGRSDRAVACRRAAVVATANRARLLACDLGGPIGTDADVVVSVEATGLLQVLADWLDLDLPPIRARALAGPARDG